MLVYSERISEASCDIDLSKPPRLSRGAADQKRTSDGGEPFQ